MKQSQSQSLPSTLYNSMTERQLRAEEQRIILGLRRSAAASPVNAKWALAEAKRLERQLREKNYLIYFVAGSSLLADDHRPHPQQAGAPAAPLSLGAARIRERTTCSPTRAGPDEDEPEPVPADDHLCVRGCGKPRRPKPKRGPQSKFCVDPDCERRQDAERKRGERGEQERVANVDAIRSAFKAYAEERRLVLNRSATDLSFSQWATELATDGDGHLGSHRSSARIVPATAEQKIARRRLGKERATKYLASDPPPKRRTSHWGSERIEGEKPPPPWKVNAIPCCPDQPRPRTARRHLREKEEGATTATVVELAAVRRLKPTIGFAVAA